MGQSAEGGPDRRLCEPEAGGVVPSTRSGDALSSTGPRVRKAALTDLSKPPTLDAGEHVLAAGFAMVHGHLCLPRGMQPTGQTAGPWRPAARQPVGDSRAAYRCSGTRTESLLTALVDISPSSRRRSNLCSAQIAPCPTSTRLSTWLGSLRRHRARCRRHGPKSPEIRRRQCRRLPRDVSARSSSSAGCPADSNSGCRNPRSAWLTSTW
jgi:hypothetical protein